MDNTVLAFIAMFLFVAIGLLLLATRDNADWGA